MSDDRQRVVVIKLVVKLVWVRIVVSRLWRARAVVRRVMLLTGVVRVAALRTGGGQTGELICMIQTNHCVVFQRALSLYICVYRQALTSLCLEECDGGCRRCVSCLLWSSASPPPQTAKSIRRKKNLLFFTPTPSLHRSYLELSLSWREK